MTNFSHENIIKYCPESRPFNTVEDMNEHIVEKWNSVVSPEDTVYHLGDCFMGPLETVEIIRFFAKQAGHKVWISRIFNPFVWLGSFVLQPINKMFATYYYDPAMSKMNFDYQLVSFEESLKRVADSL